MHSAVRRYSVRALILALMLLAYAPCFLDRATTARLTREDGLFEDFTALGFLVTAVLFLMAGLRLPSALALRRRIVLCWLLSGVFLVGFLEEISWGQRILRLKTPEPLVQYNYQKEINIHNLIWLEGKDASGKGRSFWRRMINVDRWFSLFWFGLCVVLPVASRMSNRARARISRLGLPLVPLWLGSLFMLNYVASKLVLAATPWNGGDVVEIKEANFALLFLVVALLHLLAGTQGRRAGSPASSGASAKVCATPT